MALELIGKSAPLPSELEKAASNGFKKLELYMKEEFLTDKHLKFLSDAKRNFGIDFYSIHTPHSKPESFLKILKATDEFAKKVGIPVIVAHSTYTNVFSDEVVESLKANMFVENGHNHNLPVLQDFFQKGVNICFDTAHFYVASLSIGRDYYEDLETLLRRHRKNIGHMHIADSKNSFAGMKSPIDEPLSCDANIGDGVIDFSRAMRIISKYYDGIAVVEVEVERQPSDINKLKKILFASLKEKSNQ